LVMRKAKHFGFFIQIISSIWSLDLF